MAATNYTPIVLYNSGTTTNAPVAGDLAAGELAINYKDGFLFYKDDVNVIQKIGYKITPVAAGGTGSTTASDARTALGLAIGTNVQAYDADLTTWAGITPGTGVATALAVNVGSAGAPVLFNGAYGTPTTLTLTNATGLPAAGVTGTALVAAAIGTTVQAYDADLTTWAGVTPGTGVATALAVAVGSAGAPVVFNGALGTPSSATLTNATGLPAAGVTGTALVAAAIGTTVQAYDADLTTWAGITPGTGVGTALAVAVGSAGALVANGGALGTPSSGTLTNCTFPALPYATVGKAIAMTLVFA
jgi:hypothetical protein